MKILTRLVDGVLGPRCRFGCGQRVFPSDAPAHEVINHAGDVLALRMRDFARAADTFTDALRAMYRTTPGPEGEGAGPFSRAPYEGILHVDAPHDGPLFAEARLLPEDRVARRVEIARPFWVSGLDDEATLPEDTVARGVSTNTTAPATCEHGARLHCTEDEETGR